MPEEIKDKKPASKKEPERVVAQSQPQLPQSVTIANLQSQKVILNIFDGRRQMRSVELDSKQCLVWPRLDDYGPYADQLVANRSISITSK